MSVFHQLHCLVSSRRNLSKRSPDHKVLHFHFLQGMIRESYHASLQGRRPHIHGDEDLSDENLGKAQAEHTGHCFDYLRQALICAADMTLEWAAEVPPGHMPFTVDGWGITHQCRNWNEVIGWVLEHRGSANISGIA